MAGKTTLESRLQDYDGVAVSILSEARIACRTAAGFHDDLIRLCCDQRPAIADGATWILKAELEAGVQLSAPLRLWLSPLLNHQRPFLRTWALDGLCHLPNAGQEPEILQHLDAMENDPAASVRARARALRKMFGTNPVK